MTSDSNRLLSAAALLGVFLLAAAAVFAFMLFGKSDDDANEVVAPAAPGASVNEQGPKSAPIVTGTVEVVTPEQAGVPLENCIAYPDGTRLPPLNGVEKAPRVPFHRRIPYTKVVGRITDARGLEWYVHENGAWSTTRYQADGKAVGDLMLPVTPGPVVEK